jgi:hypothetical protein
MYLDHVTRFTIASSTQGSSIFALTRVILKFRLAASQLIATIHVFRGEYPWVFVGGERLLSMATKSLPRDVLFFVEGWRNGTGYGQEDYC